jgi:HSP20 family protein
MPGLSKDDIEVVAQENVIHIKAHNETRNYDTDIPISVKVDQETAEATYNNGILDLKFTLLETADEDGFNIPVN